MPLRLNKKLIFVTGKGGVGKTTVSAAIGVLAAESGRRTLICEVDTEPAMGRLFGGQRIEFKPVQVEERLFACNLSGRDCLQAFIRRFAPGRKIADLILRNKIANIFFESAPSVMEAVILDQLAMLIGEHDPPFDTIVVDLPASGHAVTFLKVPKSMARMVAVGELAEHLRRIATIISDPRSTEVVIVTLPDEMAVNETLELWHRLRDTVDTPSESVIVNGTRAMSLRDDDLARVVDLASASGAASPAFEPMIDALKLGLYWRSEDAANVERLSNAIDARVMEIPFVFHKADERELVQSCADALRPRATT